MSNKSRRPQAPDGGLKVREDFEEDVAPVGRWSMDALIRNEKRFMPLTRSEGHLTPLVSLAEPEPHAPALRPARLPASEGSRNRWAGPPPHSNSIANS